MSVNKTKVKPPKRVYIYIKDNCSKIITSCTFEEVRFSLAETGSENRNLININVLSRDSSNLTSNKVSTITPK